MTMFKEFEVHMLNDHGKEQVIELSTAFDTLLGTLLSLVGPNPSREMSICRTKLEEACFFAKKALAQRPENTGGDDGK